MKINKNQTQSLEALLYVFITRNALESLENVVEGLPEEFVSTTAALDNLIEVFETECIKNKGRYIDG